MARFSWRKWFGFESNLGRRDELRRRFRPRLEALEDRITPSPVLCTDLPAYRQGALVQIAGTGFDANEQVTLQVVPSDGSAATNSWTVVAGADGSLNTSWNVASVNSAGDGFTITAAGADGDSAQTKFAASPIPMQATLTTDLWNYSPGATALISGSGFVPGETVTLKVIHSDTGLAAAGANPWTVTAGRDGSLTTNWYVNPVDSSGAKLTVTATGTTGDSASADFTDATELVNNSGFETGNFSGWLQAGNTAYTSVSTATVHSGRYSAQLGPILTSGGYGQLYQYLSTVPGQQYTVSFWLASGDTVPANEFSVFFGGSGTVFDHVNISGGYQHYSVTVTASLTNSLFLLAFYDNPSFLYLDDVSVQGIAATTTSVSSSSNASTYGQSVFFTALTGTSSSGSGGTPTGTVQFQIDGNNFGSPVAVSGGTATSVSISTLTAANHTVTAIFSDGSSYASSSASLTQTVNKTYPTLSTAVDAGGTYNGSPFPATGTVAGINGQAGSTLEGVGLNFYYYTYVNGTYGYIGNTAPSSAGTYYVESYFPGSVDYNATSSSGVYFTVNKATPTITWSNPGNITDLTSLSTTQLDATANVPGAFSYSPGLGTMLSVGANQTLSAIFTPTDSGDYTSATKTVTINVIDPPLTAGVLTPPRGSGSPSVSTFAGGFTYGAYDLALDAAGNLYVAYTDLNTISKVTPGGAVSTFVSSGLNHPIGLAFDGAGNLYVANDGDSTISRVTPAGAVSTFVGSGNGINHPRGMTFDAAGNLYVANWGNNTISKVTPGGAVSIFLGSGNGLSFPYALAFDSAGNLYITNSGSNTISKVTPGGAVSTFVGNGGGLSVPDGLAFNAAGNLYVANWASNTISEVTPGGVVSAFVGSGNGLSGPGGMAFDAAGNLYVANAAGSTISEIGPPSPTEGQAFSNVAVFHFTDADPAATVGDYTAVVTLGDGNAVTLTSTPSANGQIVANPSGGFDVQISHTYAEELTNQTFSVQIYDNSNGRTISDPTDAATGASTNTFSVTDARLSPGTLSAGGGVEGVTATSLSTAFTDANTGGPTTDFSGTINWGDGSTTPFTSSAVSGSGGSYTVSGAHKYAEEGTYSITVTVNDVGSSSTTISGSTTVADAPPVLSLPANQTFEATNSSGATVNFTGATATDYDDSPVTITYAPTQGCQFPLGTTTVTATGTNADGTTATGTFTVTVLDTTPPALTLPANQTVEATGPSGAADAGAFTASAVDLVDGADPVHYFIGNTEISSTYVFPLDQSTTVTVTSTDAHGNTASGAFTVEVQDTTPPTLSAVPNQTLEATSPAGAVAVFSATATDVVDGSDPVHASIPSGSTFGFGTTTVHYSATDHAGNTASGSFTVTVQDTIAPVTTAPPSDSLTSTYPNAVSVSLSATDSGSGVAATYYDVDGGSYVTYSGPFGVSGGGTHTVSFYSVDVVGNQESPHSVSVTINKATPSGTVGPDSIVYGTALAGAQLGASLGGVAGAFSFGSQEGAILGAGTHAETYTFTPNDTADYTTVTDSVFVNVNPKAASVTPNAQSKVYGTADPVFTGTLSGFLAGDGVTATYSRAPGESVLGGPYTISASLSPADVLSNYSIAYNTASFTITPAPLTVSGVTANNKVYDGGATATLNTAGAGLVGVVNGDAVTLDTSHMTGAFASKDVVTSVGSLYATTGFGPIYQVNAQGVASVFYSQSSDPLYGIVTDSAGNFFVADAFGEILKLDPAGHESVYATGVGSARGLAIDPSNDLYVASGASVYKVVPTGTGSGAVSRFATVPGSFGIALDSLGNVFVADQGSNSVYEIKPDGSTSTFATNILGPLGITIDAANNLYVASSNGGNRVTKITPQGTESVFATHVSPGSGQPMGLAFGGNGTLYAGDTFGGNSISAISMSGAVQTFVTGINANMLVYQSSMGQTVTVAGLTLAGGAASNYTLTQPTLTATITPEPVAARIVNTPTKIYDGRTNATLSGANYQLSGLVGAESFTLTQTVGTYNSKDVTATTVTAGLAAGDFTPAAGTLASDYALPTSATGVGVITPAPLTITAAGVDKVYDGTSTATVTLSDNRIAGDVFTDSYTAAVFADKNVGASKPVSVSGLAVTGRDAGNYTFNTTANTTASITPASLTISADSKTKDYGAALPTLTASYSGFVNGDDSTSLTTLPTLTTTATAASHVSGNPYSITASGAVDGDYTIAYAAGTLTVNPVALTISADSKTKDYGAALPTLTASYSGFVNGDTAASLTTGPTLSTTATAASHVGDYAITAAGGADADYTISYANGNLTVNPVALTITADNQSKAYGAALPTLTASYSGFVNGDTAASLTTGPTLSTTATAASHVGDYAITAAGAADADYTISYANGTLHITPATLTVTADDQTRVYGQVNPALTASYTGLVNGDTVAALTGGPALATAAGLYSTPGAYTITTGLGSLADPDYLFHLVNGVLTVNEAATGTSLSESAATPLFGVDTVTFTAGVSVAAPGGGVPTGSVDFYDATTLTDLGSIALVNGTASLSTGALAVGSHAVIATYSGDGDFLSSAGSGSLNVLPPASLSGTVFADFNDDGQIDFGENGISGVSVHLTGADDLGHAVDRTFQTDGDGAFLFLNLRPGSYYLTKTTQPSGYTAGVDSVGTAGGSLSTTVADQFFVRLGQGANGLNYNYGERPAASGPVQKGQTAGIGFWNNKNGQALILALNGGGASHELGDWLAATFVNLYGAKSRNNLAGKSNAYVAALFQQDFLLKGMKLDAQVLATALSVYATNATLDNTQAATKYGFTVSGYGIGTATFNVGRNGAAFGVANNTTVTVMDLLLAADRLAVDGLLYNGDATDWNLANNVFSALNQAGGIS